MSRKRPIGAISFGIFLMTCGIAFFAYATDLIVSGEVIPLIAIFNGVWILVLAAIRHRSPAEYEMGAFVVGIWGVIILCGGTLWFLSARGVVSATATLAVFVVLIGILAVMAGAREWVARKR